MHHAIRSAQLEECVATCHMFGIRFQRAEDTRIAQFIFQLYTTNEQGGMLRQVTVEDTDVRAWRAAISRLISVAPESFW